jgi:hypothetical protein
VAENRNAINPLLVIWVLKIFLFLIPGIGSKNKSGTIKSNAPKALHIKQR